MVNTATHRLLRVSELSRLTGVSTSAINYYVREGLLPPPLKTAPNMAYFDPGYVDMVNSIKVLQREKKLSLGEIKELLEKGKVKWHEGPDVGNLVGAVGTTPGGRALDRRKQIMGVASKVFAEKGYYATTVADLASAAGIAKGTIYWYFNNKQAIMLAILDDIVSEINESFGLVVRDTPNGLEAILRCVEPSMKLLEKHGPIYLMYFLEIGSTDRVLQEKYRDIYRAVHAGTKMALERGMKEGLIRKVNPELAAYGVMGLIERISQVTGPGGSEIPVGLKIKEAKELLRHALVSKSAGSKGSQR